jgi:hypothetical protein
MIPGIREMKTLLKVVHPRNIDGAKTNNEK